MNWVNVKELEDYLYCPELWWHRREQNTSNLDIYPLRERYEKRWKKKQTLLRLQEELKTKKRKAKRKKSSTSVLGNIAEFVKRTRMKSLEKQLHPARLVREEKKVNPRLLLADVSSNNQNIYCESINVRWETQSLVVTLDRSDTSLPSYLPNAFYSDLCILVFQMFLVRAHFFTDNIKGKIKYKNYEKEIYWKKNSGKTLDSITKRLLNDVTKIVEIISSGKKKQVKPFPFRCGQCELASRGCTKMQSYPKLDTTNLSEENIEQTYLLFAQAKNNLYRTSWIHWQKDAEILVKIIYSSPHIQQDISKYCKKDQLYDIEEMIRTAALYKRELFNRFMLKKDELTFAYQFLLYLSTAKVEAIKKLVPAYGVTERYDTRTSLDILINNCVHKILRNFLEKLDQYLQSLLPSEQLIQIHPYIHIERSQINLSKDHSVIHAKMTTK